MARKKNSALPTKRPALSLAGRINLIVSVALALGLGLAATVFAVGMASTRARLSAQALEREADILYSSIQTIMLAARAPDAVRFFGDVAAIQAGGAGFMVGLYRRDGTGAFTDNATISTVNLNLKKELFAARLVSATPVSPPERPYFDGAVAVPPSLTLFRLKDGGRTFDRIYRPLLNLPKCAQCHGSDHTVRGVIDLRFDVTPLVNAQTATVAGTSAGFAVLVTAMALAIGRFMRKVVVDPVSAIARVCAAVTAGDFSGRVESARSDEVGRLGLTVNQMVLGLHERYELTKYVSAGTISSLAAGQEPRRVERTLLFTDVRGFTAYTETHGAEAIVGVLNLMLDEQSRIIRAHGGDVDKFVGDEIVSVFSGDDAPARACRAAAAIRRLIADGEERFGGLAVGMGIASGSVVQGMVGSSVRADFTVIGDAVNVASRLCSMARRGQILLSANSYRALAAAGDAVLEPPSRELAAGRDGVPADDGPARAPGAGFACSGPYRVRLKGKKEDQRVYLLLDASEAPDGMPAGKDGNHA